MAKLKYAKYLSEKALSDCIHNHLAQSDLVSCSEVPMLGRSIDLVLLKRNKVISIEFKLKDWRKAMIQAKDYLLASDFVYICMPQRRVSEVFLNELKTNGIGLLFPREESSWPFIEVVKAKPSDRKWSVANNDLKKYLKENRVR